VTRHSLRARLALAGLLSIALALLVASVGLVALFERHVERRIGDELTGRLNQLAAALTITPDGGVSVDPTPAEPRFEKPLSGLYWQIDDATSGAGGVGLLRSRSLWDGQLRLPPDRLGAGSVHAHLLTGPGEQQLLVRERSIRLAGAPDSRTLRLAVAEDRAELVAARNAFAADMLPYLGVIALVLGLATWAQIRTGLAPLEAVRRGVNAVRAGHERRLPSHYPEEVQPLVAEVNALLAAREEAVAQARSWTADLAHGLKTPLSALAADADRLRQQGNPALAHDLEQLADHMRRRVDRELIRARVRTGARPRQARADVGDALRRLLATLERTPDGARIDWLLDAPAGVIAALAADDLLELLGNLLENAAKWAGSRVEIRVSAGDTVRVSITDDGPGVPAEQLGRLGERGLRLDERKAGSGLGLAIARDVADAYGGVLELARADSGGLAVTARLPAAPPEPATSQPPRKP
jgi:signal transduction histidine kinase